MKIGIICPKGAVTGGPEALHQLFAELSSLGRQVRMIDAADRVRNAHPASEYETYQPVWAEPDEDLAQYDFLIVPETITHLDRKRFARFEGEFVIWWLSVDNSNRLQARLAGTRNLLAVGRSWGVGNLRAVRHWAGLAYSFVQLVLLHSRSLLGNLRPVTVGKSLNIAQSAYAAGFVKRAYGVNVQIVSDFVPPTASDSGTFQDSVEGDLVTFNGSKGATFCALVADYCTELRFVPLRGLSRQEVSRFLSASALYLDLGHFPGKDRLPREAAKLGTPVLISSRGSGGTRGDFELSPDYLVDLQVETPEGIGRRIRSIVSSRPDAVRNQKGFGKAQLADRALFSLQVLEFVRSLEGRRKQR